MKVTEHIFNNSCLIALVIMPLTKKLCPIWSIYFNIPAGVVILSELEQCLLYYKMKHKVRDNIITYIYFKR